MKGGENVDEKSKISLWDLVATRCLKTALSVLEKETDPTAATVETVKSLVETAISIDRLDLKWAKFEKPGLF